ncbi:hypothetical protein FBUS_01376 [Fasciolopsis buskii]|uniref:BHLH domain-containing protein n=1 Tax=Fasciolopsis buskii TaxID=27845 RepID=A0A8E0S9T7_9TREM|nr:hypothetical protein FBUS_01376 [Fasciolopsis buski]
MDSREYTDHHRWMHMQPYHFHQFSNDTDWIQCSYKRTAESQDHFPEESTQTDQHSKSQVVKLGIPSDREWTTPLVSDECRYTCHERRRRKRASAQYRRAHAARERLRVEAFNQAFSQLRTLLPVDLMCGNTQTERRLSKLQVLRLCSVYIFSLTRLLYEEK